MTPAAQTGDVILTPSSRALMHHVMGRPAPCGAVEQTRRREMYPCTHDGPGPRPVVFTRGRRSTPRLRTGPATASNGWAQS